LVVDLRGVSFLDAAMLRALVRGCALLLAHQRRFALIRPRPLIWRTFVLTGLNRLPSFAGVPEAVESFRG
jgi:anti-anti-sigma factor